ncbi:UDP-glycosyltransferase 73C6-like [Olea europaea var. sylvestris]|uniref:Glycosyltransferase n=1 Tax=Olea europaea subsp. europaea TaxID=158383 RepID=A0A8S0UCW2_OLEEU|nr:UDP-glycosyltransferase 73C6-like [Olea europaea var. sylvestris]CAA3017133.1 UDP-glycosyltransferase 73C6-like [Olea europaea subsp. europaea]
MALQPEMLNFVLIPLMAPGHIIPMIDMAKLFAERGIIVTIVTTPLNTIRFNAVIDRAISSGLPIRLLQLRFPCQEAGLPVGCESVDTLPSYKLTRNFFIAAKMLQKPLEQMLKGLKPAPSCIICDKHLSWTADLSNNLQIPRIIFDGMSCFTQLIMNKLQISKVHETVPELEPFVVPSLPDRIEFTKFQLPELLNPRSVEAHDFSEDIRATEALSYGVVVNSFEDLEQRYVDEFLKIRRGKVWCIGPLSLFNRENLDKAQRGNKASIDTNQCLRWLDSHEPDSVIYACLGSLSRQTPSQFIELALGLEASNSPFILVIKGGEKTEEIEKWILEDGFDERIKERGLLIRGWAPQVLILSHSSVGGFLTHCGWNSTLEGICAGLPMITWPLFAEQFLNEKLVVQILGTGVRVGAEAAVDFTAQEGTGIKLMKDEIKAAIDMVMDKGKKGCERREKAKALKEMAKRSVEEGGSSYLNTTMLIQDIEQLVKKNKEST